MLTIALLVLGVGSAAILTILVVSLARRVGRLARAMQAFEADARPIVERLRTGSEAAKRRMQELSERATPPETP